jgi:hypothetical protein
MLKKVLLASVIAAAPLLPAHAGTTIIPGAGFFYVTGNCHFLWGPGFGWFSYRAGTMGANTDAENVESMQTVDQMIMGAQVWNRSLPSAPISITIVNSGNDAPVCGGYSILLHASD